MQTPPNTERYMVTLRGSKMAIRLGEVRVFDVLTDALDYAKQVDPKSRGYARVFLVANDKRPKEINYWEFAPFKASP